MNQPLECCIKWNGSYVASLDHDWLYFQINQTEHSVGASNFRLNPHYVVWYRNLIQFSITILLPFTLLTYWNLGTAILIKRRHNILAKGHAKQSRTKTDQIQILKKKITNFSFGQDRNSDVLLNGKKIAEALSLPCTDFKSGSSPKTTDLKR